MEEIKCPVCFEMPPREIFQCCNGHIVCSECSKSLSECPQCRVKFEEIKIRCRTLENLLDTMKFDCVHKSLGCDYKLRRSEHSDHLENCNYGPNSFKFCKYLEYNCDFRMNSNNLEPAVNHLMTAHDFVIRRCSSKFQVQLNGLSDKIPNIGKLWTPVLLLLENIPGCLLVLYLYNKEDDTISMTSIFICEDNATFKMSDALVTFSVTPLHSSENPDLNWITQPINVKHAKNAIQHPYLRIPRRILNEKFVRDGVLTLNCSIKPPKKC